MKYDIEINGETEYVDMSLTEAKKLAIKCAKNNDDVYITWYRRSDGQHGYLNPSGNHEIIGKPW